ncbi:hypothetical protein FACS1894219_07530 [Clostridia bacterium]|nr:hypothetical protein FACS1894219_07530 [Clostridia bacterium]
MKNVQKFTSALLALIIAFSFGVTTFAADAKTLDNAVTEIAAYILKTVASPEVGSVGGEWAIIGLARSGYAVPDCYCADYYTRVEKYVKDKKGILHPKKYTEYSRIILGLTAAGYDPRNVGGYDLTAPLGDFGNTIWQGVNGPIWALIALDSDNYDSTIRDKYIAEILNRQLSDGGWNLSGNIADPDMTGMALTALARYSDRKEVKSAIDKALKIKFSYSSSEGVVQMLVANATLGKDTDALVAELLKYRNADGSFNHVIGTDDGNNQMASEQALYGLVAAQRVRDGKNGLYDMRETVQSAVPNTPQEISGLPGKHTDVTKAIVTNPGTTFPDIINHINKTAIEALAARGIVDGSSGKFNPDGNVTRVQFSKMVTLSLCLPAKFTAAFTDMPSADWAVSAIGTAYYYEIVNGIGGGKCNPDGTITRQDAAVMVARAAKLCGMDTVVSDAEIRDTLAQFGDYKTVADYAQSSLAFCFSERILDDSEFDIEPKKAATRAEIAEMLYKLLDKANLL